MLQALRTDNPWIPGHPNYRAVPEGKIWSCRSGRFLKPVMTNGYPRVVLAGGKSHYVHILVAAAYHGLRPAGHHVDHIDHDRANSRPENLRYIPEAKNVSQNSRNFRPATLQRIRAWLKAGWSNKAIAARLSCAPTRISAVRRGSYGWHDPAWKPVPARASGSKLRPRSLARILRLRKEGLTYATIAAQYDVSLQTIFNVCQGKRYGRFVNRTLKEMNHDSCHTSPLDTGGRP